MGNLTKIKLLCTKGHTAINTTFFGTTAVLLALGIFFAANLILEIFSLAKPPLDYHHDFLAFYSAGYLALHGNADKIFDPGTVANLQYSIVHEKIGAAGYMAYINPPFVATLLAPLALLTEPNARVSWLVLNLILALLIVRQITKPITGHKRLLAGALLFGTFPFYQALTEGQPSIIILTASLIGLVLAKRKQTLAGGVCLSLLTIKPQLAVPVLVGLLIFRQWKMVLGMTIGVIGLVLATLPLVGIQSYLSYTRYLFGVIIAHFNGAGVGAPVAWRGDLNDMYGINSFWVGLFGQAATTTVNLLTTASAAILAGLYLLTTRKVRPGIGKLRNEMILIASITLILLTDPHLYAQDLVMLFLLIPVILKRFKNPLFLIVPIATLTDLAALDPILKVHLFPLTITVFTTIILVRVLITNKDQQQKHLERKNDIMRLL
jgi:hypothetical protein